MQPDFASQQSNGAALVPHYAAVESSPYLPVMTMATALSRREMLVQFTGQIMKKDVDYGVIPGTPKPTLLKPGAEKLCNFFGLEPTYEEIKETVDWTGREYGEPFYYIRYRCLLKKGDRIIGSGEGSSNSWETKHRYRWVREEDVPHGFAVETLKKRGGVRSIFEPDFAIDKSETTGRYGKPADHWQRFKDAIAAKTAKRVHNKQLGAKTYDGWEITVNELQYRIPNPDFADAINTIQKIAQKRALIAAALIGTSASEFFTQDIEDLPGFAAAPPPEPPIEEPSAPPPSAKPVTVAQKPAAAPAPHPQTDVKTTAPAPVVEMPKPKPPADNRRALQTQIGEAIQWDAADTDLGASIATAFRGYLGIEPKAKFSAAQAKDIDGWTEMMLAILEGVKAGEITIEHLKTTPYELGQMLRKSIDAAPEEPTPAAPIRLIAADVTEEILAEKYNPGGKNNAFSIAKWYEACSIQDRSAEEKAAWRRIAWHSRKAARMACQPKCTIAAVLAHVENASGSPLSPDLNITEQRVEELVVAALGVLNQ